MIEATSFLSLAFASCIEPMLFVDGAGQVLEVNLAAARLSGTSIEAARGQSLDALLRPASPLAPLVAEVLREGAGRTLSTEVALHLAPDARRRVEVSLSPIPGEAGAVFLVLRDVTEQWQAEREVREREAHLQDAVEELDAGFVLYGPDERLIFANARYWEIYPYGAAHQTVGSTFEQVLRTFCRHGGHLHSGMTEDEWVAYHLSIHRGTPGQHVQKLSDRWIRFYDARTSDGCLVGLRTDVTALKEAEQALDRERQYIQRIIDANPNVIYVKDREGRYVTFNRAFAEHYGPNAEEMHFRTLASVMSEGRLRAELDDLDRRVLEHGERAEIELPFPRPNGQVQWYLAIKVPLVEADGTRKILGVSVDVTERKRHEQAIRDQLTVIQEQQRLIHALSTPILEVAEGVIALPVIGALDDARAAEVTAKLLEEIARRRARVAILDVTGIGAVDAGVADRLTRLLGAIRLLGAEGIITGIQPAVARTFCDLGEAFGSIRACATLRDGLSRATSSPRGRRMANL